MGIVTRIKKNLMLLHVGIDDHNLQSTYRIVSFCGGDAIWASSAKRLFNQARRNDFFSSAKVFNPKDLVNSKSEVEAGIPEFARLNKRGFGFWLWKPTLILSELDRLSGEAGIAWIDCGCTLNVKSQAARANWLRYENLANSEGYMFFRLQGDSTHRRWTKREAINHFPSIAGVEDRNLYAATAFFVSNSAKGRELLTRWRDLCLMNRSELLNDSFDPMLQDAQFKEHRHDQSLLSLILEDLEYETGINDETYFAPKWGLYGSDYPIWATRLRSRIGFVSDSMMLKALRKLERILINKILVFKSKNLEFNRSNRSKG